MNLIELIDQAKNLVLARYPDAKLFDVQTLCCGRGQSSGCIEHLKFIFRNSKYNQISIEWEEGQISLLKAQNVPAPIDDPKKEIDKISISLDEAILKIKTLNCSDTFGSITLSKTSDEPVYVFTLVDEKKVYIGASTGKTTLE